MGEEGVSKYRKINHKNDKHFIEFIPSFQQSLRDELLILFFLYQYTVESFLLVPILESHSKSIIVLEIFHL